MRVTCVVDGDTFWRNREKYRIADIDTPEVDHARCPAERALGLKATRRLAELMGEGQFAIQRVGTDRYGRTLAKATRGGRSIGSQLVREGLAHRWGRRRNWC
jgi:micrococcal nuclease